MTRNHLLWLLFAISYSALAQNNAKSEQDEVLKVFELFFKSMRERDTLSLKEITMASSSGQMFFWTTSGNDQRLQGSSGSTSKGFIGSVGQKDSPTGACRNEFENFSVRIYGRYAVVSVEYTCFINEGKRIMDCIPFSFIRRIDGESLT